MKKNKKAFSLLVAMWLVLISSLLAYTILEFIVPFSKDVKWIENSTMSYYMANNWIEEGLYFFSKRTDSQLRDEYTKSYVTDYDYKFNTFSSWTFLPPVWKWNSPFDKDWNTIGISNPIQLIIWLWFVTNVNTLSIDFRVPDFNRDWLYLQTLSWTTTPMINWQLVAPDDALNATTANLFTANNVNAWVQNFNILSWKKVSDGSIDTFPAFFSSNNCNTVKCVLKISIINPLEFATTWWIIPYLEWKMNNWANNIPLQYSVIESEWKSNWFVKKMQIKVPQETVSEAFDFTVFQ